MHGPPGKPCRRRGIVVDFEKKTRPHGGEQERIVGKMKPSFAEKAAAWRAEGWRVLALLGLAAAAGVIAGGVTAGVGHGGLGETRRKTIK